MSRSSWVGLGNISLREAIFPSEQFFCRSKRTINVKGEMNGRGDKKMRKKKKVPYECEGRTKARSKIYTAGCTEYKYTLKKLSHIKPHLRNPNGILSITVAFCTASCTLKATRKTTRTYLSLSCIACAILRPSSWTVGKFIRNYSPRFTIVKLCLEGRETPLSPPPPSNSSLQTSPRGLGYTCGPIDGSLYAVVHPSGPGGARGSPLTVSMDSGISSAPPQRPSPPELETNESQAHGDLDKLLHDMMLTVEVIVPWKT